MTVDPEAVRAMAAAYTAAPVLEPTAASALRRLAFPRRCAPRRRLSASVLGPQKPKYSDPSSCRSNSAAKQNLQHNPSNGNQHPARQWEPCSNF